MDNAIFWRAILARLILIAGALLFAFAARAESAGLHRYVLIGGDPSETKEKVQAAGGTVSHDLKYHAGFVAHMSAQAATNLRDRFGASVLIEKDAPVKAERRPSAPTQPLQSVPWGIRAVRALEAHASVHGEGVMVCVIDTGIQPDHPDLAANVLGGENFVLRKGRLSPSAWADDNGHGTHVAGTIAALDNAIGVVGVAPEAGLFAVKVLNQNGSGYLSDVAEGIRSCLAHGADVINMSLGSSADATLVREAVEDADAAGLIQVAAAGNQNSDVIYPAKYPQVIAVSAVDSELRLATFSNTGSEIDFTAPGVNVVSTTQGSGYAAYSGTSMASPHVAGTAALLISAGKSTLRASDIGLSDNEQGQGLIDALKTVQ